MCKLFAINLKYECNGIESAIKWAQCTNKYTARHEINVPAWNGQAGKTPDSGVKLFEFESQGAIFTTTRVKPCSSSTQQAWKKREWFLIVWFIRTEFNFPSFQQIAHWNFSNFTSVLCGSMNGPYFY